MKTSKLKKAVLLNLKAGGYTKGPLVDAVKRSKGTELQDRSEFIGRKNIPY